ncbi:MAG: ATP-grasp domain-containing protein [Acidimicrobiales bacterium]
MASPASRLCSMPSADVALVTFAGMANGYEDDALLAAALSRLGADVTFVCWDDAAVQWAALDLAVVRSTWDYHQRPDAFLAWADFVRTASLLVNDAPTLRWNSHKGYLLELATAGVPVVPTVLARRGEVFTLPAGRWVVKPAVSIGAERTVRDAAQADLDALVAVSDVLVQPYVREVESGEVSLVCFGGVPSHAVRKVPAAGDFRTQEHLGATVTAVPVTEALDQLAGTVLSLLPTTPAYARVDVVDTPDGPLLMELELIEPTLFFAHEVGAADALAALLLGLLAP